MEIKMIPVTPTLIAHIGLMPPETREILSKFVLDHSCSVYSKQVFDADLLLYTYFDDHELIVDNLVRTSFGGLMDEFEDSFEIAVNKFVESGGIGR